MKKFSINCTGSNVEDAMAKIGELSELNAKQKNCLTLLTEEMFSMMSNVLDNKEATFSIEKEENVWTLSMTINALVTMSARQEYLSLATDGKNLAHKGLKGLLNAFIDALSGAGAGIAVPNGMIGETVDYVQLWQMSQYIDQLPDSEKEEAWDGLEKSIIANFADDVMVGVTENKVQVIVKKTF